ncbi:hypothetical protein B0H16DRAFT_1561626 [Mycena metata]|uniref:Uncharacterized protein n=1 Tax=Mycena metata TaxID=1033252 RepID=A0AAD7N2F4_9AGAR|nr:hypothetical protein B0H16DRAFT_1561626 [Mycena metata]
MVALRFTSLLLLPFALASTLHHPPKPSLPSLTDWAANGLAGVITAPSVTALQNSLDAWLSTNVSVILNGLSIQPSALLAHRTGLGFNPPLEFSLINTIEVQTVANSSEAGEVSLAFSGTIGTLGLTGVINAVIFQDPSLKPRPVDPRRIINFNEIFLEIQ